MRFVHWLFVVSVALFVSGIAFLVASARTTDSRAPVEAVPTVPVANVRQIMQGITGPAASVLFTAVGTTITVSGTDERAPKDEAEWLHVANNVAALVESGNLLMMGSRAVDREDWVKMSRAMMDAGVVALKASEARDAEALLDSGDSVNRSCDNCHQRYMRQ